MSQPAWIGRTLGGRYVIEALLGQGGMSAVYRATDPNLRRAVAIKLIHPHLTSDPDFVRRFEAEAAAVAQLRHPNLIQVYDFNHDNGTYYMVLEFVPGETLHTRLARITNAGRALPTAEILAIGIDVAEGIEYAHQRGLIHRDIKPANIMINPAGQAVLMDFGIAKIMGSAAHTATGTVMGTAQYISPEQVRGERPTTRSDIYSLGVTLFEMAAGRPPFEGDSAMSIMLKHVNEPVPDLAKFNPRLPPDLVAIVRHTLEKEPDRRMPSGAALAAALRQVQARLEAGAATVVEPPAARPAAAAPRAEPAGAGGPAVPPPVFSGPVPGPAAAAPTPAAAPSAPPRKLPLWLLAGVPALLLLCVAAVALAVLSQLGGGGRDDRATATVPSVAQATQTEAPPATEAAPPATQAEPSPAPPVEPTVAPTPGFDPAAAGMAAIPAGTFEMGTNDGAADERPPHTVTLDAFYLDQFEVTNARYAACVEAGACQPPAQTGSFTREAYFGAPDFADYPVVAVNWEQAAAFCAWDGGKRLPTEAEWEYAARGTDGRRYPWGQAFDLALLPAAERDTVQAGSFPAGASPFGVHDLAGNALEWVADYYEPLYYAESVAEHPPGPEFGEERVLRGGSFGNADAGFYTATRRYHLAPEYADVDVGFRCARGAAQ
jgi:serine/threonine-protein kinase